MNLMSNLPEFEGEYLFYYGNDTKPFFTVNTFRFTVEEDEYETRDWYLEDCYNSDPTSWFHLLDTTKEINNDKMV